MGFPQFLLKIQQKAVTEEEGIAGMDKALQNQHVPMMKMLEGMLTEDGPFLGGAKPNIADCCMVHIYGLWACFDRG